MIHNKNINLWEHPKLFCCRCQCILVYVHVHLFYYDVGHLIWLNMMLGFELHPTYGN